MHPLKTSSTLILTLLHPIIASPPSRPQITPPPSVDILRRQLAPESDPAFLGWEYGNDFTYTPSLCYALTDTLTTWNSFVDCCVSGAPTCRLTTGCSSGTALVTELGGTKTWFDSCKGNINGINSRCVTNTIYSNKESTSTPLYYYFYCRLNVIMGSGDTLFASIPAEATVNTTVSRYTPGVIPSFASSPPTSLSGSSSSPRLTHTTSSTNPSESAATTSSPTSLTASSNPTAAPAAQPSKSGLSRSDSIALGVGVGIGLPTVAISLIAWLWPRYRPQKIGSPNVGFVSGNGIGIGGVNGTVNGGVNGNSIENEGNGNENHSATATEIEMQEMHRYM